MRRVTLRQRFRYWFDNTMSRGTPALIGWLAVVSIALVVALSSMLVVVDSTQRTSFKNALKEIWINTVDTFKLGKASEGEWDYRIFAIALAVAGIFFASTLISLLTTGVNRKISELRKGRSMVLEKNHTVLIGWSDQVYPIVSELVEANSNRRRAAVAILADRDRVDMEDDIHKVVGKTRNTRVVCRTGSPIDPTDLDTVNPQMARSIIVLTPEDEAPDAQVVKTLVAVTNSPTRRKEPYHVVAAIRDARNHAAAKLAGGDETSVIDADDIAARLIVQTCRQSGLSVVYTDLLDFAGDEIYLSNEPKLLGRTFGEAVLAYRTSAVIGLHRADGDVLLNPPPSTVIEADDEIIAISEDDDTVVLGDEEPSVELAAISPAQRPEIVPERTLVLGWNRRAASIVRQLNSYVVPGSVLDVVADAPDAKDELDVIGPGLTNLAVSFSIGDTDERGVLETLDVAGYDHVIVLCYDTGDPQYADSRALITLLHLREMQQQSGKRYPIVSEMSDDRNRKLAQVTRADDFIVSDKLISLLMAQLSENRHLAKVFGALFSSEGSEIYLKPASEYVEPGRKISFYTVAEAARQRSEVAIGYRIHARSTEAPSFGVVLNPDKQLPLDFAPGDRVIVLAEE